MSLRPVVEDPHAIAAWLREQLGADAALQADSRAVRAGDGFVACPGLRSDGRKFIAPALLNGARAVLWQREGFNWPHLDEAPHRAVSNLKDLAGAIAHEYYGRPSEALSLIAVTGTNGKTSCTQWLAAGHALTGETAAVVGTLGSGLIGHLDDFGLTTPDAIRLHGMLARFRDQGASLVAIEASSIGLDQGRLDGARVVAAVFTNLTHDHLDYHKTLQAYGEAKARLFARPELELAVVNGDDPASAQMLAAIGANPVRTIAFGETPRRFAATAERVLIAQAIEPHGRGLGLTLDGDFGQRRIELGVLGRFNAMNVLAVMATWLGLGMDFDRACELARQLQPVRGRMEKVALDSAVTSSPRDRIAIDTSMLDPLVVVDYAHTPDALANALSTLAPLARARGGLLWCVFGAGGDRDPAKRPIMGGVVETHADRVVVTSDNPRGESAYKIIADIRAGLTREPHRSEVDRAIAIRETVREAAVEDVVLVAGKGHETYQEIAGERFPFSDVEVARAALKNRSEVFNA